MNNFKRYSLRPLPVSLFLGLILWSALAACVNAQTTNRDEIRAKIKELETREKELNDAIAYAREMIQQLDSKNFIVVDGYVVSREYVVKRVSMRILLGELTPEQAASQLARLGAATKQFQAELRKEIPQLESQLEKTRDEISYYVNELARLNERPPSAGGLVLKGPEVTPPHDDVGGMGNTRSHFSNTATSADIVYTITSDGKLVNRIQTHFDYVMRFSGNSEVLRPGDTVTITITGRDSRTPKDTGGGYGVAGQVWYDGLQAVTGKECNVGAGYNDGYHPTCTGEYVGKVSPGAEKVVISFGGNFGIGVAATYTWEPGSGSMGGGPNIVGTWTSTDGSSVSVRPGNGGLMELRYQYQGGVTGVMSLSWTGSAYEGRYETTDPNGRVTGRGTQVLVPRDGGKRLEGPWRSSDGKTGTWILTR